MLSKERVKEIQKQYPRYRYHADKLQILVCQIKIWTPKDPKKPLVVPDNSSCLIINEVETIDINETFQKLINTATVKFPRGTVIKKTITAVNQDEVSKQTGIMAEVVQSIGDMGVVSETTNKTRLATIADFSVGQRIQIKLGYVSSPSEIKYINNEAKNKFLRLMFDGYIAKCSVSTPIEIKCENLAYALKKISCKSRNYTKDMTVNKLLELNPYMLKGTGLSLYPATKACDINIGPVTIDNNNTVADVFSEWNKFKLFSFIKYIGDTPYLAIGRSYFASKSNESILKDTPDEIPLIQFDYDVAKDDLTLMSTKKEWLAVEASMIDWNDKQYKVTIRLNPNYDKNAKTGDASKKYDILKETKLSKKAQKFGAVRQGSTDKVDLSTYTIIPFMHGRIVHAITEATQEQLIKEAIAFFEGYEMNGIEGSITIFGDHAIRTATKVELLDIRHSGKNGYYVVDEVNTTFGINGYRQTIKLPYRLTKKDMKDSVKANVRNVK